MTKDTVTPWHVTQPIQLYLQLLSHTSTFSYLLAVTFTLKKQPVYTDLEGNCPAAISGWLCIDVKILEHVFT